MLPPMGRAAEPPAATRRIDEMTSREVESYLKEGGDLALIPFGPVSGHRVWRRWMRPKGSRIPTEHCKKGYPREHSAVGSFAATCFTQRLQREPPSKQE